MADKLREYNIHLSFNDGQLVIEIIVNGRAYRFDDDGFTKPDDVSDEVAFLDLGRVGLNLDLLKQLLLKKGIELSGFENEAPPVYRVHPSMLRKD